MIPDRDIHKLSEGQGHRESFRLLVDAYGGRLYGHIRRLLSSAPDAEDVFQNTLLKVWQHLPDFKGESKLYTWLYRIATNEALLFIAKEKRRVTVSLDDDSMRAAIAQVHSHADFEGDEIQARLLEAVSRLPDKQRLVFMLRYFDGLGYDDISLILNTSVGGLKANFHHAVKKIERLLTEQTL